MDSQMDDQSPQAFTKSNHEFQIFTNLTLIQDSVLDVVSADQSFQKI